MHKTDLPRKSIIPIAGLKTLAVFLVVLLVGVTACKRSGPTLTRGSAGRTAGSQQKDSDVLLRGIATTLNDLTNRVDLELNPEQPLLTARTTDDGSEVLAACSRRPGVDDGPFDYLYVPSGSVDFRSYGVRQGDLIRYYANLDLEAAEQGFEDRKAIPLRVRRIDDRNPSAIILEGGLNGEVTDPVRMEIWRISDERMDAIASILRNYYGVRRPAVGWEPSPDDAELQRLVERCNQWWRNQADQDDKWQATALLETLPEPIRNAEHVSKEITAKALAGGRYQDGEGRILQQAVWCRDIAAWAGGVGVSKQELAAALFDWAVRHIQLVDADEAAMVHHPWQAIAYGRGTAEHRAWVFAELCRQRQIDVVVLALPEQGGEPAFWLSAAAIDGSLFLFDSQLGMPIPSPSGAAAATLSEVVADPSIVEQLTVDGAYEYLPATQNIEQVQAFVVASPWQLAQRNARLQSELEGDEYVVLAANADRVSEAVSANPNVAEVKLWPLPFDMFEQQYRIKPSQRKLAVESFEPFAVRPRLWKARALHFMGRKDVSAADADNPIATAQLGHQEAAQLYTNRLVRPPESILESMELVKRNVYERTKAAATYWVGLLNYDTRAYDVSARWFEEVLPTVPQHQKWDDGARYNLARAYEALGDLERAIELLESDPASAPQKHGNLIRAKMLRGRLESGGASTDADNSSTDD